jgi:hypothetical protein
MLEIAVHNADPRRVRVRKPGQDGTPEAATTLSYRSMQQLDVEPPVFAGGRSPDMDRCFIVTVIHEEHRCRHRKAVSQST